MTCKWPVDLTCVPDIDPEDEDAQALLDRCIALASDVLWAFSGRRFGACPATARPCPDPCETTAPYRCWCGGQCRARGPSVIHLPGPVASVLYVSIEGEPMDDTEWIAEGDLLYRTGHRAWPAQDLTAPLGEPGTWSVSYLRGVSPPPHTARLVGLLTAEFYAACTSGKCKLPRRVQSVTRQGLTFQMADPTSVFAERNTGITEVDLWLAAVNPHGLMSAPKVR